MDKDTLMPLALAALVGAGGGTGTTLFVHQHPEIIREIREVQYEGEVFKLTTQLEAMEDGGQEGSPSYMVAQAQLVKFTQMLAEID